MNMELTTDAGGRSSVALHGRVDAHVAPRLTGMLAACAGSGTGLVEVDMTEVTFIDRSGLLALRLGREGCRAARGDLTIGGISNAVRAIFELTDLGADMLPERVALRRAQAVSTNLAAVRIAEGPEPGEATVTVFGALDSIAAQSLRSECESRLPTWRSVTADLTAVPTLDGPGLATLRWLAGEMRRRGGEVLVRGGMSAGVTDMPARASRDATTTRLARTTGGNQADRKVLRPVANSTAEQSDPTGEPPTRARTQ